MSIKHKILKALGDIALEDVKEETLLGILLDSYTAKQKEIERLAGENSHEREILRQEWDRLRSEEQKIRTNACFWVSGMYRFKGDNIEIHVEIRDGRISVLQKEKNLNIVLREMQWNENS
jgi:hypothetical protein